MLGFPAHAGLRCDAVFCSRSPPSAGRRVTCAATSMAPRGRHCVLLRRGDCWIAWPRRSLTTELRGGLLLRPCTRLPMRSSGAALPLLWLFLGIRWRTSIGGSVVAVAMPVSLHVIGVCGARGIRRGCLIGRRTSRDMLIGCRPPLSGIVAWRGGGVADWLWDRGPRMPAVCLREC